jgi:type IV secretory pathway ATPase VirB11/archaellum biosynthesis ATPase
MCIYRGIENRVAIMDSIASPYELYSPDCINSQLKQLALLTDVDFDRIRYEEEIIIEFDEQKTSVIKEYVSLIRQVELIALNPDSFGRKEDDYYQPRKKLLRDVLDSLYQNPLIAEQKIMEYKEPEPTRGIFLEGYRRFGGILLNILDSLRKTKMYSLVKQAGDMRTVFLQFAEMKSAAFVETITLEIPSNAKPIEAKTAKYDLPYGWKVQIYELPDKEANMYVQTNDILQNLSDPLKKLMRAYIASNMQQISGVLDYAALYDKKLLEYRQYYLDTAAMNKIPITQEQALTMAKETVNWTLGLGAPIENLALDQSNITDIYIDAENSPLYLEHVYHGICHTQYRYNRQLLEYAFLNATLGAKIGKKLDERNPLIDLMLNRLNMRLHLQGPPATFGELQGALRIMKPTPFTYSQYLHYNSMSAFFAGYDDVMVSLGTSEGVMGIKGCGKTSFTAAKIVAIGTKKRIIPVQDIEEIPTRTYRKYGFHIGSAKVAEEEEERTALSLVKMTSALLRMGDAAVIINELRSRTAVQGIINLLNTQPGVFLLYNFHAESLRDVQDRLELVFGIPAASMFATDRYTFMHKLRFGRKERLYRIINKSYESDPEDRKFVETFSFTRGSNIANSKLECGFVKNPEATLWTIEGVNVGKLEKELNVQFIPPALSRRARDTGIAPEQYMLEAFMKGKVYSQVYKASVETGNPDLREIGFVLKANAALRKLMKVKEKENGEIDYNDLEKEWNTIFPNLVKEELRSPGSSSAAGPSGQASEEGETWEHGGEDRTEEEISRVIEEEREKEVG